MMRKLLILMLIALFLMPSLACAMDLEEGDGWPGDGWFGEDGLFPYDDWFDDFDEPMDAECEIRPATEGYICDLVYISGWTLTMGYTGAADRLEWGILGQADFGEERVLLEGENPIGIVPCGDSFVYYGYGTDGRNHWLISKPMETPKALPLTWKDAVFYGDGNGIWYTSSSGGNDLIIRRMGLDGKNIRRMGTVRGTIRGVLTDSSIVLVDFAKRTVSTWKDGKTTVIYASDEPFRDVAATNETIWVIYEDHFGQIVNGVLSDDQEGYAISSARSGNQLVLLVLREFGAKEARVMLINDVLGAYADMGSVPYDIWSRVEMRAEGVIVWGGESRTLSIPTSAATWMIYEHLTGTSGYEKQK